MLEDYLLQHQTRGWMLPATNAVPDTQLVTDAQVLMLINYEGMQPFPGYEASASAAIPQPQGPVSSTVWAEPRG